jgi:hypothetical protein
VAIVKELDKAHYKLIFHTSIIFAVTFNTMLIPVNFLGVEANIGFAYKLTKSYIFIEGGGNYGFLNIQKGTAMVKIMPVRAL